MHLGVPSVQVTSTEQVFVIPPPPMPQGLPIWSPLQTELQGPHLSRMMEACGTGLAEKLGSSVAARSATQKGSVALEESVAAQV